MVSGDHCCYSAQIRWITFPETCSLPLLGSLCQCLAPLPTRVETPQSSGHTPPCPVPFTLTLPLSPVPQSQALNRSLIQWSSTRNQFTCQRTLGNACRQFWLCPSGRGGQGCGSASSPHSRPQTPSELRRRHPALFMPHVPCPTPSAWPPSSQCNGSPFRKQGPQSSFLNCKSDHLLPCAKPTVALVCQAQTPKF